MSAQHTPGPWTVEDPMDNELTIVEANKATHEWRFIASCSLPEGDDDQDFTGREVHANARLIAEAPAMKSLLAEIAHIAGQAASGMPENPRNACSEIAHRAREFLDRMEGHAP